MNEEEALSEGACGASVFRHAWVRMLFYGWLFFFTTYAFYRGGILAILWYYLKKVMG